MLSRTADSLYWMARYLERAENTARVFSVHANLMLERGSEPRTEDWTHLVLSVGVDLEEAGGETKAFDSAVGLLNDSEDIYSVGFCVERARENARAVRELISSEMWEQLNRTYHQVRGAGTVYTWGAQDFLQGVINGSHLFKGVTDSTMTNGEGWQFIQAGRYMERTARLCTLIRRHFLQFHHPDEPEAERKAYMEWIGLLRSCTAFEAYCKVYTAELVSNHVAEFLILHPSFPHSIHFSAKGLETAIREIGEETDSRRASGVERIAGRLRAMLGFGQIDEVMSGGLDAYLDNILRQTGQVHGALYQTYIGYPIEEAIA
jgi:uncharacterized alpha-E superfamily protein